MARFLLKGFNIWHPPSDFILLHSHRNQIISSSLSQCFLSIQFCPHKNLPHKGNGLAVYSTNCTEQHSIGERSMGITMKEQQILLKQQPRQNSNLKHLKVAIIGAPNAGKSTLLNHLLSWKISSVSEKVHTTRCKTMGVLTEDDKQVVFLDTPGVITPAKAKRHSLEISLLRDPHIALSEADIVLVVVDVCPIWNRARLDPEILKLLHLHRDTASVLVLNKVDLIKPKDILLGIVRNLTDGVVGNQKDWSTVKQNKKGKLHIETLLNNSQEKSDLHHSCIDPTTEDNSLTNNAAPRQMNARLQSLPVDADTSAAESEGMLSHGSVSAGSERGIAESRDLNSPEVWATYYKHLCDIGRQIRDERGWRHFDAVFMVSAIDNDGVFDLKNYLLDNAYSSPWVYHSSVITDQNPVELATLVVKECLLNHLPDEVPYCVNVRKSLWEVGEDNFLRASFDIQCTEQRHASVLLGKKGQTLRTIAAEAKQQLMNVFRREMSLKLVVRVPAAGSRAAAVKHKLSDRAT